MASEEAPPFRAGRSAQAGGRSSLGKVALISNSLVPSRVRLVCLKSDGWRLAAWRT